MTDASPKARDKSLKSLNFALGASVQTDGQQILAKLAELQHEHDRMAERLTGFAAEHRRELRGIAETLSDFSIMRGPRREDSHRWTRRSDTSADSWIAPTPGYSPKRSMVRSSTETASTAVAETEDAYDYRREVGKQVLSLPRNWPLCVIVREDIAAKPSMTCNGIDAAFQHREQRERTFAASVAARSSMASVAHRVSYVVLGHPRLRLRKFQPTTLSPFSAARLGMDILSLVALFHDLAITPFILAWDIDVQGTLQACALLGTLYWTVDLIANFFTGFYQHGEIEMRLQKTVMHYLTGHFLLDLSLIAGDWIALVMMASGSSASSFEALLVLRISKVSRLFRLVGLFRLARLNRLLERRMAWLLSDNSRLIFQILKLLFVTLCFNHLSTCIWFVMGVMPSDTGTTWLDFWREQTDVRDNPAYEYLTAFHWSLAQVTLGSNEIFPLNSAERAYTIILMLFGLLFGSTIVAIFSSLSVEFMMGKRDQMQKLATLRKFLQQKDVRPALAARVQHQAMERLENRKQLTEDDVPALQILSNTIRLELSYELRKTYLVAHPLFHLWTELDLGAVKLLCSDATTFHFFAAGDDIFTPSSAATSAYFLVNGQLSYQQEPDTSMVPEPTTTPVDGGSWLCEAAVWAQWKHVGRLETQTIAHLLLLSAVGLLEVLRKRLVIGSVTKTYGRNFHARIVSATPPYAPWPTDLRVPFTDVGDLLPQQVGLRLLKYARRIGMTISDETMRTMEDELKEEQSSLSWVSADNTLERTVFVVALKLEKPGEGKAPRRLLVQLGKWDKTRGLTPSCALPGTKRSRGEPPQHALDRLLRASLHPFAPGVRLTDTEVVMEVRPSTSVGIRTRYFRAVHAAMLDPALPYPDLEVVSEHTDSRRPAKQLSGSLGLTHAGTLPALVPWPEAEVFLVRDGTNVIVYSWLLAEEFSSLEGVGSAFEVLKEWLLTLHVEDSAVAMLAEAERTSGSSEPRCLGIRHDSWVGSIANVPSMQSGGGGNVGETRLLYDIVEEEATQSQATGTQACLPPAVLLKL